MGKKYKMPKQRIDQTITGKSSSSSYKTTSRFRTFCGTNEPHHITSLEEDVLRQLSAWSEKEKDLIDINARFVNDIDENWISKKLAKRLGLEITTSNVKEYGHLDALSLDFLGTVELQWFDKSGRPKSEYSTCKVVDHKSFDVLQEVLLTISSLPSVSRSIPIRQWSMSDSMPTLSPNSTNETLASFTSQDSFSVGSFDGSPATCEEGAPDAISADDWILRLKNSVHVRLDQIRDAREAEGNPPKRRVKIAVLDTGIDTSHEFIKGAQRQIKDRKSFVRDDVSIEDNDGHGTHIAALLLDVTPDAEVYIAKVATHVEIPSGHKIADAINWAVLEKEVDIITMSLGLEREHHSVQKAILNAIYHRVLIFAAASNGGGNSCVTYPARKDEVICVYATDGIGTPYDHNPTPMEDTYYDFAVLGVGVKSAWPRHLQKPPLEPSEASERRMTGTSFATPIAAGIAACIIEFAYLTNFSEDLLRVLKSRQGMQKTLKELMVGKGRRHGFHYIYPWAMFKGRLNEEIKYDMKHILES